MLSKKIIMIGKNNDSLAELSSILIVIGYDLIVLNSNHSILNIIIQEKPYAILVELEFTRKEGFQLIDALNQTGKTESVPIIALVDLFKEELKPLLQSYGIDSYLKKPFKPLDVIWAVENLPEENNQLTKERFLESAVV